MEQFATIFWVVLGVVLIVAEIFTLGFVLLWFGVGALIAATASAFGLGFASQFILFIAVAVILSLLSRTIFANFFAHDDSTRLKMGVEALPGKIGTVSGESRGALNEAAVKVFGSTWTAFPIDGEKPLRDGEKVEVVEVRGSSIYVRRASAELEEPEWRNEKRSRE